ncbi:MAG: hypothetical protein WBD28_02645 [Candidatus Zixiibacteriota bacterium]
MSDSSVLKWRSHPFKRKKLTSLLVILCMVAVWISVYLTTFSVLMTVVSVIILLGALSPFFLPTDYELTSDKIKVRFFFSQKEKEWSFYRSFYVDKKGVFLSPFERPSRMENFRGIYIRVDQNKDQVVEFVSSRIKKDEVRK